MTAGTAGVRHLLAAAAAHGVVGRRELRVATLAEGVARIADEVAATMLPRRVTFTSGAGVSVEVHVADRTLLRAVLTERGSARSLGCTPSDPDAPALRGALARLFEAPGPVSVTRVPVPPVDAPGLAHGALCEVLGLTPRAVPEADAAIEALVAAADDRFLCALRLAPEAPLRGSAADLDHLAARLAPVLDACDGEAPAGLLSRRELLLLDGAGAPDLVLVAHDGMAMAALARPGSGPDLARFHARIAAGYPV